MLAAEPDRVAILLKERTRQELAAPLATNLAEEQYPGMDPKFLTINTRVSPTFVKELQSMLPKNVEVVAMPDFIGLAEEAGAVVASPYSDGVGAGDSVKVKFQLHNASGQTGKPGKVTWTLPTGWKSSPAEWEHGGSGRTGPPGRAALRGG